VVLFPGDGAPNTGAWFVESARDVIVKKLLVKEDTSSIHKINIVMLFLILGAPLY
jgi:hypothetical protein